MSIDAKQKEALKQQALRIHARYTEEFVEALHLCPWAQRARKDGHTKTLVVLASDWPAAREDTLRAIDALAADESIEVGFVVFPRLRGSRKDFEQWVGRLREANAESHGGSPPMACAAFHPEAEADVTSAARLVPFIRRSPDPTIQAVRRSVLEAVRAPADMGTAFVDLGNVDLASLMAPKKAPLHERVGDANLATIRRDQEQAEAILREIEEDRAQAYAEILGEDG